jgi:CRP-like cAMP-binding protein
MLKECSNSELRLLDSLLCEIDVAAGRVLVREDQVGEQMLVVIDGRARVSRHGETLGLAERGAIVRGPALRDPRTEAVTMTADTPMTVGAAGPREMRSILHAVPALEAALWGGPTQHIGVADEAEAYLRAWTEEPSGSSPR